MKEVIVLITVIINFILALAKILLEYLTYTTPIN